VINSEFLFLGEHNGFPIAFLSIFSSLITAKWRGPLGSTGLNLGRCQELSSTRYGGVLWGPNLGRCQESCIIYKTILQNPQANPLENHYIMEWPRYIPVCLYFYLFANLGLPSNSSLAPHQAQWHLPSTSVFILVIYKHFPPPHGTLWISSAFF
jgi:hypothetical protein